MRLDVLDRLLSVEHLRCVSRANVKLGRIVVVKEDGSSASIRAQDGDGISVNFRECDVDESGDLL
jgi:hypothetical protein